MVARAEAAAATRDRIADAALQLLLDQPYEDVTLAAVAEAAKVSHQTVLNHFESKEGVARAAAAILAEQTKRARYRAEPGNVAAAVKTLMSEYERFGDANARWAGAAERLGSLATLLDEARAGHQEWLEYVFGALLPTQAASRRRAIHALHAATDVFTWRLLRRDLELSRSETEKTIADLVEAVIARAPR